MFNTAETVVLFLKTALKMPVFPAQDEMDDIAKPFVTYTNSAGASIDTLDGDSKIREETFRFTIHTDTYDQGVDIRDLMIEALSVADLLGFVANSDDDGDGISENGGYTRKIEFVGTFQAGVNVNMYVVSSSFAEKAATASYVEVAVGAAEWGTLQNKPSGLVSSSAQVDFNSIQNKPTVSATASYAVNAETAKTASYALNVPPLPSGIVTASEQINYNNIQNKPTLIETASYVTFANVANKPTLISSSAQIPLVQSSSHAEFAATAKNASTASYVDANIAVVGFISSSILAVEMVTGSTQFGDSPDDTHEFTGSVKIKGALEATASWSNNVPFTGIINKPTLFSSSLQVTKSFDEIINKPSLISSSAQINFPTSSAWADAAGTALTASYALNAGASGMSLDDSWVYCGF